VSEHLGHLVDAGLEPDAKENFAVKRHSAIQSGTHGVSPRQD
jgi:hypothetical protein